MHVGEGPGRLPHLPRIPKIDPRALHEALHQNAAPDAAAGAVHIERLGRPPARGQNAQGPVFVADLIGEAQLAGAVDAQHEAAPVAGPKEEVDVVLALGQRVHGKFLGPLHAEDARQLVVSLHEADRLFHGTSPPRRLDSSF